MSYFPLLLSLSFRFTFYPLYVKCLALSQPGRYDACSFFWVVVFLFFYCGNVCSLYGERHDPFEEACSVVKYRCIERFVFFIHHVQWRQSDPLRSLRTRNCR